MNNSGLIIFWGIITCMSIPITQMKMENVTQKWADQLVQLRKYVRDGSDLATCNQELTKEWDYESNGDLTPREIVMGSVKKSWWKCSKGHKWEETIANRINGNDCPYCSNKINDRRDGFNQNPELAKEWDYKVNCPICSKNVCNDGRNYAIRLSAVSCETCQLLESVDWLPDLLFGEIGHF